MPSAAQGGPTQRCERFAGKGTVVALPVLTLRVIEQSGPCAGCGDLTPGAFDVHLITCLDRGRWSAVRPCVGLAGWQSLSLSLSLL